MTSKYGNERFLTTSPYGPKDVPPDGGSDQKAKVYFDKFPIRYHEAHKKRTHSQSYDLPLGDPVCRHPSMVTNHPTGEHVPSTIKPLDVKMCAGDWLEQPRFDYIKEIIDPDGWDRSNWGTSWAEEITAEEMDRRVCISTVAYNYIPGVPQPVGDPSVTLKMNLAEEFVEPGVPDKAGANIPGTVPWAEIAQSEYPAPDYETERAEFEREVGPTHLDNVFGNLPRTPDGVALQELHDRLAQAWTADTSSIPLRWRSDHPAWGQCAVTAVLVHCFVGGLIIRGKMNHGRTHYWNISKHGETFDLTRDQFTELRIVDTTVVTSESLLKNEDTWRRYRTLLQNLAKVTIDAVPPSGGDYSVVDEDGDINLEVTTSSQADLMKVLLRPGLTVEMEDEGNETIQK